VLDLDLHDSAWTFQVAPSRANLVRLAAVLPRGKLDATIERDVRHLVTQGARQPQLSEVKEVLCAWPDFAPIGAIWLEARLTAVLACPCSTGCAPDR
jgi:hypothetical protein